jgi:hypothetical protein
MMSMQSENRIAPRRITMITARIVYDNGRRETECIIRNLSESGAKLEVSKVASLPNTFDIIARGYRPRGCRVVWRALREVGVQFTS